MEMRSQDKWGAGYFGAPRGTRNHKGVDIVAQPGTKFECFNCGTVTKLGYAYEDDLSFRYVEIADDQDNKWRYFYILPSVSLGDKVETFDKIGKVQVLDRRYPGITEHVHFEVISNGEYINPTGLIPHLDIFSSEG